MTLDNSDKFTRPTAPSLPLRLHFPKLTKSTKPAAISALTTLSFPKTYKCLEWAAAQIHFLKLTNPDTAVRWSRWGAGILMPPPTVSQRLHSTEVGNIFTLALLSTWCLPIVGGVVWQTRLCSTWCLPLPTLHLHSTQLNLNFRKPRTVEKDFHTTGCFQQTLRPSPDQSLNQFSTSCLSLLSLNIQVLDFRQNSDP